MKLKFFVLGSCYSGYMFKEKLIGNQASGNLEMIYQHQHDSLISVMTDAVNVEWKNATSKYQWDYNHFAEQIYSKGIVDKIISLKPDYLVYDTYAEAVCPIAEVKDNVYITANYYIQGSSSYEQLEKKRVLSVEDAEREMLFRKYSALFFEELKKALPDLKIILVRGKASSELWDHNVEKLSYFSYATKVEAMNRRREKYEQIVMEEVPNLRILSMDDYYYPADSLIHEHYDYEISHNHFPVAYYQKEYDKLKNIVISDFLGGIEKTKYFNQAICIVAAEDFELLLLIAKMCKDFFNVYILLNQDYVGKYYSDVQIEQLREIPNVFVVAKYRAPRGSYNELLGLLELTDMAFQKDGVHAVHYLSGNDMPIRPINEIYSFFEKNVGMTYLNLHANGKKEEMDKVASYTCRQFYYDYNADETDPLVCEMRDCSVRKQKEMGVFRKTLGEFENIYKGVLGGTISREAYFYCKEYALKHPEYMEDIKFSRLRSEYFFHTILFNCDTMKNKVNSGVRGGKHNWIWDDKKKDYAELDMEQYLTLKADENTLFVRNVCSKQVELLDVICCDIKTPYKIKK